MKIIIFIAIYLPLQEFLLKWLPVGDSVFFFLRQVPDFLLLALFLVLAVRRIIHNGTFKIIGRGLDLYVGAFVLWAFAISVFTPGSDFSVNFSEIYTLLRYSVLVYCIQLLEPSDEQIKLLLHWILVSVLLQVAIGFLQYFGGISVRDFLAARDYSSAISGVEKVFTGAREEGKNNLMGTMGDNINFAYLMSIGVFVCAAIVDRKVMKLVLITMFFVMLLFSGSRTIFVSTALVYLSYLIWLRNVGVRNILIVSFALFLAALFLILRDVALTMEYDYSSFWALFRSEIMINLMNQRLGMFVFFLPELVLNGDFIFGLSPDRYYIAEIATHQYESVPLILLAVFDKVFEDFYWVALLAYYGLIGLSLWVLFFVKVGLHVKPLLRVDSKTARNVGFVVVMLLILTIPLNMANQAFESRYFSFYLWLFIGLAVFLRRRSVQRTGF